MNKWIFLTFELVTYALFGLMVWHACTATRGLALQSKLETKVEDGESVNRRRWLSMLLWGVAFGVVIELLLTKESSYTYGDQFLVMFDNFLITPPIPEGKAVPLCVGVGWGILLYATTWASQRLRLQPLARALYAGLLAVSVDLSLDPSAHLFQFWNWPPDYALDFFGVPFDNFICWLVIVTSYTGLVRLSFTCGWLNRAWGSVVWIPFMAAAFSLGIVFVIDEGLAQIHRALGADLPAFMVFFGAAIAIVAHEWWRSRPATDLPVNWPVLAVPLAYPLLCLVLLLTSDQWKKHPALLWVVPLATIASVLAFALGSLDRRRKKARALAQSPTARALSGW